MDDIFDKRTQSERRVPHFSQAHNVIPALYVQEWKTDTPNRRLIIKNCELGMLPHYEHDDNLYLNKREQMAYNVEERARVDSKYTVPDRSVMLKPERHHPTARYKSTLMHRLP